MKNQINVKHSSSGLNPPTGTIASNVLKYTSLLRDTLSEDEKDTKIQWWSDVLEISVHWLLGEENIDEKLLDAVNNLPESLFSNSDNMPKALHAILNAKMLLLGYILLQ